MMQTLQVQGSGARPASPPHSRGGWQTRRGTRAAQTLRKTLQQRVRGLVQSRGRKMGKAVRGLPSLVELLTSVGLKGVEPSQLQHRLALTLVLRRSNWGLAWWLHAWTAPRTRCDSLLPAAQGSCLADMHLDCMPSSFGRNAVDGTARAKAMTYEEAKCLNASGNA